MFIDFMSNLLKSYQQKMGTTGLKANLKENQLFTTRIVYDCRKNIDVLLNTDGDTDLVWK